jgi:hypothetical protein
MEFPGAGNGSMLNYLSKFVLQMLPTISATVIGAYIVSTWINPKTPPEPAKVAARAQEPAKPAAEAQPAQDAMAEATETKPADVKPADVKPAETPKPVKAASAPEKVRVIPIVKPSSQPAEPVVVTASAPEAVAQDERRDANKDANELARAAIQRLRGNEAARPTEEPAKPVIATARAQPPRITPDIPPPGATIAPPLPPAVSIAAPRIAAGADQAAAYPDRMSPPGEIPTARNPLNLQASARIPENTSITDDFLSATKSFFRAITP